ncbi:MAG: N-acetyl-gamma-glutamyl-phosphate reductase [Verrucomicrobiota bacterium]|nr:N-acetyl-gamma-glutamyl-phosphate reductase [Verrucomicrobiota bacterium]
MRNLRCICARGTYRITPVIAERKVKVAVVGASGYAGEELLRLLLGHGGADLISASSRHSAGQLLAEVFPRFAHHARARELRFTDPNDDATTAGAGIVFLALPHGVASGYAVRALERGQRVIDLSADFRTKNPLTYEEFYGAAHPAPQLLDRAVYGLPEFYRDQIRDAKLLACPGCYPTSILISTLPLLAQRLVRADDIIADCLSGVSGAGRKVELPYLFTECNESLRPYGVPKHRHLSEIEQELSVAAGETARIQFTPHLVPVTRGILTTIYLRPRESLSSDAIGAAYERVYGKEPFVRLLTGDALPDTKNVVGTNFIEIAWRLDARTGRLIVMSAEDNVVKGTSGQAVQCFNLMCGFAETTGLLLS